MEIIKSLFHLARNNFLIRYSNRYLDLVEEVFLQNGNPGKKVFIAAMPKSGSTYISHKLASIPSFSYSHLSDIQGSCEFDIYRPSLIKNFHRNLIVQQHTLATPGNVEYLKRYNIPTIVLVRNIFEVIVSFKDHLKYESLYWPFLSAEASYFDLTEDKKIDYVITYALPWLVHFYVSWYKASILDNHINVLWCTYDNYLTNNVKVLKDILDFANIEYNVEKLDLKPSKNSHRFTGLEKDRWAKELSFDQVQKIKDFFHYYPEIDFSTIGIQKI
jgi:hypothetical protein